jgi:GTP-binding protein
MRQDIRNIAIIAHVDHGKTTLVDAMLKASRIFRDDQVVGELIMDSNELEREKGITILSKNTAVEHAGVKINIIDTPGHADFSGEVERVLNMADGCLLVVDAVDGPMPQTRFVLQHALRMGLEPVVVVNKIDRPSARPEVVAGLVQDLFLELATDFDQLEFPILYGSARDGYVSANIGDEPAGMSPLFDAIVEHVPSPSGDPEGGFQMLVAALNYDNHLGQIAMGRIAKGKVSIGDIVARIDREGTITMHKVVRLYVFSGLSRLPVNEAEAGEIVALAGVEGVAISDTVSAADKPEALPGIDIGPPTVQMTFGVNTSPFSGQDGKYVNSRQLQERLNVELRTNIGLRVEPTDSPEVFLVAGRGELHLSILIETVRREGYEIEVSKPEAIVKIEDGRKMEPYETLTLDVGDDSVGPLIEELSSRLARMTNMQSDGQGHTRLEFLIPTRGLIGFQSVMLKTTRGDGVMNSMFMGYEPLEGEVKSTRAGALVAAEIGTAVTYGLNNAQQRGTTFVGPGTQVYEGMIVGTYSRDEDLAVNVCKEKKLSNVRASSADISVRLTPPVIMSLEESLDFIARDEVVEVTPLNIRLRKQVLSTGDRQRMRRGKAKVK